MTKRSRHHSNKPRSGSKRENHKGKKTTHSRGKSEGYSTERESEITPLTFEEQPSQAVEAIKVVGGILKAIGKGTVKAIGEFGEYVAKNQEEYELAEERKRLKIQKMRRESQTQVEYSHHHEIIMNPPPTIIVHEYPTRYIPKPKPEPEPKQAWEEVLTDEKGRPAVSKVLGLKYKKL